MFNVDFDLRSAVKAHQPITEAEEEFLADLPEDDEEFFDAFVDNARDHGPVSCWVTLGRGRITDFTTISASRTTKITKRHSWIDSQITRLAILSLNILRHLPMYLLSIFSECI